MKRPPRPFSADEVARFIRAIKLAHVPGIRVRDACAKYGLNPRHFARARRELAAESYWTGDDVVIAGLVRSPATVANLIAFIEWVDRATWTEAEVIAALKRAETVGLVAENGGKWRLIGDWP
ncbi:MAG: hypothetical protein HYY84_01020 [Deltaproteobacteria bacterium]|nr:hypothetical protein [Deltaproteobacteria bacterium]